MAFSQVATWQHTTQAQSAESNETTKTDILAFLRGNKHGRFISRAFAASLSVAIQLLLLWALSEWRPQQTTTTANREGGSITIIGLATPIASDSANSGAPHSPPLAPKVPIAQSIVELSSPPIPTPEWSVQQIAAPVVAPKIPLPAAPPSMPGVSNSPTAVGTGSGVAVQSPGGSSDVYDPYAGAAPARRDDARVTNAGPGLAPPPPSPSPSPSLGGRFMTMLGYPNPAPAFFDLDRRALDAVEQEIQSRLRGAHGTVIFAVRISPRGIVLDAMPKSGISNPRLTSTLQATLRGKRLFIPRAGTTSSATIDLPIIIGP
jgi:hypothetical protein